MKLLENKTGERRKQESPEASIQLKLKLCFSVFQFLPFTRKINITTAQILKCFLNGSFSQIKNQGLQDWLSITAEAEGNN